MNTLEDLLLAGYQEDGTNGLAPMAPAPRKFTVAGQEYTTAMPLPPEIPGYQESISPYFGRAVQAVGQHLLRGVTEPIRQTMNYARTGEYNPSATLQATMMGLGAGWKGGLPAGETGVGLLAGRKGVKAPTKGLPLAEDLFKRGADEDAIWSKTGWRRDPKGNWAFEIDDSKAYITAKFRRKMADKKVYPEDQYTLMEVLGHDDLFENYPDLKDIPVTFDPSLDTHFLSTKDEMIGSINIRRPYKGMEKDLIHEIQHAIQEIEGWPKGGNPSQFISEYKSILRDLEDQVTAINKQLPKASGTERYNELLNERQYIVNEINNIQGEHGIGAVEKGHAQYKRLYGEFQARDSASRAEWDLQRRQAVRPYSSEMEPKEGWIFRGESSKAESSALYDQYLELMKSKRMKPTLTEKDFAQFEKPVGNTEAPDLLSTIRSLQRPGQPRELVSISELRDKAGIPPAEFDAQLLKLAQEGKVALHHHDFAASLKPEERAKLLAVPNPKAYWGGHHYYVGVVPK